MKEHCWGDGQQTRKQKRTRWFQSVLNAKTTLKQKDVTRKWAEERSTLERWKEQTIWDKFLALLPISWVTLGKLLNLSDPQPLCKIGIMPPRPPGPQGWCEGLRQSM